MTPTTTRPSTAATRGTSAIVLHRDGTVTMWSARRQRVLRHILTHDRDGGVQ